MDIRRTTILAPQVGATLRLRRRAKGRQSAYEGRLASKTEAIVRFVDPNHTRRRPNTAAKQAFYTTPRGAPRETHRSPQRGSRGHPGREQTARTGPSGAGKPATASYLTRSGAGRRTQALWMGTRTLAELRPHVPPCARGSPPSRDRSQRWPIGRSAQGQIATPWAAWSKVQGWTLMQV